MASHAVNYYNEWDAGAAAWLNELIAQGLIPYGYVDTRSITDVTPKDLEGFTQCHFFAGIGGWSQALNLARIRPQQRLWTGSPPCQPFSVAGKQLGQLDERHLAPTFMRLVAQCRPPILFGEQVAAEIGKHWLDDLFTELERQGYACGSAVLPACSVGAPHKRDRLFFGAVNQLADTHHNRNQRSITGRNDEASGETCSNRTYIPQPGESGRAGGHVSDSVANTNDDRQSADSRGRQGRGDNTWNNIRRRGEIGSVANTDSSGLEGREGVQECTTQQSSGSGSLDSRSTGPDNSFWSGADWLGCRDGKFRPVIPSFIALVDGISDSLGFGGHARVRESSEVFKLPEGISAKAFFFGRSGKSINAEASEILRSKMHGSTSGGADKSNEPKEFTTSICEDLDWSLYELPEGTREDACAPQGREPFKQRAIELDDIMRELSQQSTLAELQQRNYDAQALCALRDACSEKWSVQHSFVAVEKVWASFSEESKERERLDFNAGIWRRFEFFPLSTGEDGRVMRLRGYGNAIVPQVAAEFITAFMESI